jgi:HTH-type transcriptional repressor of NAD biosynthesis genes
MTTRGLVIGKFNPPHRGHKYLIDVALEEADSLAIIVCEKDGQDILAELRATWLQEIHPTAEVLILDQATFDDTNPYAWAESILLLLGFKPDLLFTSEDYGDEYSRLLGAQHVLVDRDRKLVPISATQIRSNPALYLDFLEPVVQSYFMKDSEL